MPIDNFGAGYASLSSLRKLEVGRIKIDRSFVKGIHQSEENRVLVQAMLGIGRSLDLGVVVEGVEAAEEEAVLVALGCTMAQGYFYAEPMPADRLFLWIAQNAATTTRPAFIEVEAA